MSNELNKQTISGGLRDAKERKKVMKTIKNYFEPLTLTLVWVYAMAIFAVAMDIFVWRT